MTESEFNQRVDDTLIAIEEAIDAAGADGEIDAGRAAAVHDLRRVREVPGEDHRQRVAIPRSER